MWNVTVAGFALRIGVNMRMECWRSRAPLLLVASNPIVAKGATLMVLPMDKYRFDFVDFVSYK